MATKDKNTSMGAVAQAISSEDLSSTEPIKDAVDGLTATTGEALPDDQSK